MQRNSSFYIYIYIYIYMRVCIYTTYILTHTHICWPHWVFITRHGLSLVDKEGYSSLQCAGFSYCRVQAQQLWHTGLVAPRHVEFSLTKDQTCVPCIGRQILNHWATQEVQGTVSMEGQPQVLCGFSSGRVGIPLCSRVNCSIVKMSTCG